MRTEINQYIQYNKDKKTKKCYSILNFQDYQGVILDGHEYQCFGSYWNDLAALPGGWATHLAAACAYGTLVDVSKHSLFVGEFSLEVTDCQKYLDGGIQSNGGYVPPSK